MTDKTKEVTKIDTLKGYFVKTLISVRLSTDLVELIDENYELITGSTEAVTDRKLFECLVDLALSKVRPTIEAKKQIEELQDKIQTLTQENNNLGGSMNSMKIQHEQEILELQKVIDNAALESQAELDNKQQQIMELQGLIDNTSGESQSELDRRQELITSQQSRIKELEDHIKNSSNIPTDAIIINITENEKKVIDMIRTSESKATGKEISAAGLLKSVLFWILEHGPTDMFRSKVPAWYTIISIISPKSTDRS